MASKSTGVQLVDLSRPKIKNNDLAKQFNDYQNFLISCCVTVRNVQPQANLLRITNKQPLTKLTGIATTKRESLPVMGGCPRRGQL